MALAALIAAYHESAEPGVLRATLPLAGRTLVERQVRLAAGCGAAPLIVLVERMPAALGQALERLRREGLPVRVARSAEEAAAAVDPNDRVLVIADGAVADPALLAQLASAEPQAVLTVPDSGHGDIHERIDAASRWAGLALVEATLLADTAAMLRDWDLQSTLLRRALQSGARHVAADGPVAILDGEADVAALERRILAAASATRGGWMARLLAPLERAAVRSLLAAPIGPQPIGFAGALLTGLGAIAFGYGWLRTGLALLLAATPLDGIASRLARVRMLDDPARAWWCYLIPVLQGAALVAIAYALAPALGWGVVLLAFTTLAFLAALNIETEDRVPRGAVFLAEPKAMAWLMLPFAIVGLWQAGLALLFAYAAGSFFWAQHEAHRPPPPRQD